MLVTTMKPHENINKTLKFLLTQISSKNPQIIPELLTFKYAAASWTVRFL